jgi:hypothetical protein
VVGFREYHERRGLVRTAEFFAVALDRVCTGQAMKLSRRDRAGLCRFAAKSLPGVSTAPDCLLNREDAERDRAHLQTAIVKDGTLAKQ